MQRRDVEMVKRVFGVVGKYHLLFGSGSFGRVFGSEPPVPERLEGLEGTSSVGEIGGVVGQVRVPFLRR